MPGGCKERGTVCMQTYHYQHNTQSQGTAASLPSVLTVLPPDPQLSHLQPFK